MEIDGQSPPIVDVTEVRKILESAQNQKQEGKLKLKPNKKLARYYICEAHIHVNGQPTKVRCNRVSTQFVADSELNLARGVYQSRKTYEFAQKPYFAENTGNKDINAVVARSVWGYAQNEPFWRFHILLEIKYTLFLVTVFFWSSRL